LPGVDDGAKTIEDSIAMAKVAAEEGITTIIATPHHKNTQYYNNKEEILKHVENLNKEFIQRNIPINILPGQEVRIYGEVLEDNKKGEILTLNHTKYLFIEFPSSSVPRYAERLLYNIQTQGIIPIIVHPERNKELQENPDLMYKLVQNGALTQVTAASVCGYFGKRVKHFSDQLIEANLTHFIASDAHNTTSRTFKINQAYDDIETKFGSDYVYMFTENAELLVKDNNIYKEMPLPIRRKKFLGIF